MAKLQKFVAAELTAKRFYEISTNYIRLSGEWARFSIPMQRVDKTQDAAEGQNIPAEDNWTPVTGGYALQYSKVWANTSYFEGFVDKLEIAFGDAMKAAKRQKNQPAIDSLVKDALDFKGLRDDFSHNTLVDCDIRAPAGYRFQCTVVQKSNDRFYVNTVKLVPRF